MKSLPRSLARSAIVAAALATASIASQGTTPARAASATVPSVVCGAAPGDAVVTLAGLSQDGDVVLADGRVLRLAGLDLARDVTAGGHPSEAIRAALLNWAAGPIMLHPLGGADRWGRIPALLTHPDGSSEAGDALLAAGLARVAPEASVHACAARRLASEDAARAAGRGLWDDPAAAVLAPSDDAGLAAQAGGLAIVKGILRVHESRGALFLALGRDRRGFVAVVSRRDVKLFARMGLDLRDYVGTPVRLRGDLDARFGPRMRLTDPDAVESLEPGSIAEEDRPEIVGSSPRPATPRL